MGDIEQLVSALREQWDKYRKENDRHASLIDAQARLQLLQLMTHFDADRNSSLDPREQKQAAAYLQTAFGERAVARLRLDEPLTIGELERLLLPSIDSVSNPAQPHWPATTATWVTP